MAVNELRLGRPLPGELYIEHPMANRSSEAMGESRRAILERAAPQAYTQSGPSTLVGTSRGANDATLARRTMP